MLNWEINRKELKVGSDTIALVSEFKDSWVIFNIKIGKRKKKRRCHSKLTNLSNCWFEFLFEIQLEMFTFRLQEAKQCRR